MKKIELLFFSLLMLTGLFVQAQTYKPTVPAYILESGRTYMIYNAFTANSALGRADNRNWFISANSGNTEISVDATHTAPAAFQTTGDAYLWRIVENGDNTFTIESALKSGYYINGGSLNQTSQKWTVIDIHSADVSNRATYTDLTDTWAIHSGNTWMNGNPKGFTTWSTAHPYQFYNYMVVGEQMDTVLYNCFDKNAVKFATKTQIGKRGESLNLLVPVFDKQTYESGMTSDERTVVLSGNLSFNLTYSSPDTLTYKCVDENNKLLKTVVEVYAHNTEIYERAPSISFYSYLSGLTSNNAYVLSQNKTVTLVYKLALPFETTAIADGATDFPQNAVWYNIKQGKNPTYLYYLKGQTFLALDSASVNDVRADKNLWCFAGNLTDGFRIYNKAAGAGKILYSVSATGAANTGGNTYPLLTDVASAAGANTWDFRVSEKDASGFWISQHGAIANTMNNRADKLAYWTGGADEGSNFFLEQPGKPVFVCSKEFFSLPGVRLMNKLKINQDAVVTVADLPDGLTYNAARNLVEGIVNEEGVYHYTATATTADAVTKQTFTLTVSSKILCPTPLMGWLSWNVFEGDVNETVLKETTDAFVSKGLTDVGYKYIIIDDKWHASSRNADGTPQYDTSKFPNGIKAASDYVHAKGLKFGIYSDAAATTCGGMFGSYGYETQDASAYAAWGCDLLKYDYCGGPSDSASAHKRYKAMGDALKTTGRDFVFYICEWGQLNPWDWAADAGGQMWRVGYDTRDTWTYGAGGFAKGLIGVTEGIEAIKNLAYYNGVNHFNDADMMMVGLHGTGKSSNYSNNGKGMTQTEYQTQVSMWSMFSSPLTLSCDVRKLSDADLEIIKNKEVIAINQDAMGQQALLVGSADSCEVYAKDLENGDVAVALLNMKSSSADMSFSLKDVYLIDGKKYAVRDLWTHAYVDTIDASYSVRVAAHEAKVLRVTPYEANTGIQGTKPSGFAPSVSLVAQGIKVVCAGSEGNRKRITVVDMNGRVVAGAEGTDETFVIPMKNASGNYVVNAICCGHSLSSKINL